MSAQKRILTVLAVSGAVWLLVMGLIYRANYGKRVGADLGTLSSDVSVHGETRQYFSVFKDGMKIGYMIASQLSYEELRVVREEVVLKVNLAGMSREVFVQSTAGIDSARRTMRYLEFRILSGSHAYVFNSSVHEDSLLVNVKRDNESPWRRGMFPVERNIMPSVALPFFMSYSDETEKTIQMFDPIDFAPRPVHVVRKGMEAVKVAAATLELMRYDMDYGGNRATVWLDSLGRLTKGEGIMLYGEALGGFKVETWRTRDVFLLPIETSFGKDAVRKMSLPGGMNIPNPRSCTYLKARLDGIRAANIDTDASNKEVFSLNPVVFGIRSEPTTPGERKDGVYKAAAADTSLLGSSDYIQPKDARMSRTAREIIAAETDTLSMARMLSRWVFTRMKKDENIAIIRSVDILRSLIGGRDEHVKLFAALARSIRIPVQINMGLLYENGAFRYHSWPSVLAGGDWHDLDPWYGQDTADAARVALVRGDFERLSELLRLIDSFTVTILEYR
jgi:hypothetical protein